MVTKGLLVRLEALPGKEAELASFLEGARAIVMDEPGTTAPFAIQMGPSTLGVFDVFPDDQRRAGAASSSTRTGGRSLETSRSSYTPRRSRSSPRCRSTACGTRCRPSRHAPKSGFRAVASLWPTAAICGSVKITRGESRPSRRTLEPGRPRR